MTLARAGGPSHSQAQEPAAPPFRPRGPIGESEPSQRWDGSEVEGAVPCESAQILARVGANVILASEVLAAVNEILVQYRDKIPKEQLEIQRKMLIKRLLEQRIDIKLIHQDALRNIPSENIAKITERLEEQFELVEVPRRMKVAEIGSRSELDQKLQALGTSLDREKRTFSERVLAQQWLNQQVKSDEEISHEEMLAYYQEHLSEFEYPARARWEQLTVRKNKFPMAAEARAELARMGNQVIDGTPLAEIAKTQSHGPTASEGGVRDWTTQGSLVSESLDKALFGLPVGQLSQILEDDRGYHIIRVLEREEARRTPFLEAQVQIREKIKDQRDKEAREAYLARLKEEIPVWTVFDQDPAPKESASYSRFLER